MKPSDSLRVLHVDDDPAVTRMVAALLRPHGIEVTQLHDPTRAVEYMIQGNFRIVILDLDMPLVNGIELLRQIKQADGGTSVIVLTGIVSQSSVLHSMRTGAAACLFKPLTSVDALLDCIREIERNTDRWWKTLRELSELKRTELEYSAVNA